MNTPEMNRRTFLKTASLATAAASLPNILRSQGPGDQAPVNKINVACCGVGGRPGRVVTDLNGGSMVRRCARRSS